MKKNWAKIAAYGTLIVFLAEMLFDPISWGLNTITVTRIRSELPEAMALWKSHQLTDYQVDVHGAVPLLCIFSYRLVVRQGVLVEVWQLPLRGNKGEPQYMSRDVWNRSPCHFTDYTIPSVFDSISGLLEDVDPKKHQVKVDFDPNYGYITHYEINAGYRMGIFNPPLSDCCVKFDIGNLKLLR